MKKIIFIFLFLIPVLITGGCWDRVEIESRGIVSALGVDKAGEEGKITVSAQLIQPGNVGTPGGGEGGGGQGEAVVVFNDTGYNLEDALRNLTRQIGRDLHLSEMAAVVISEDVAMEEGIGTIMDFLRRDAGPNVRAWVLVSRGTARKVLETKIPAEKVWGFGLNRIIKAFREHSKAPVVDSLDFERNVKSTTMQPVGVGVKITGEEKEAEKEELSPGGKILPAGSAVFRGYKQVGWLNTRETRGMLWVKGRVESGVIVIFFDDHKKYIALEITRAEREIDPVIVDGEIIINVKVEEVGNIGEIEPDHISVDKESFLEDIESRKNALIKQEIFDAVKKAQNLNTDVLGFGEAVRRKYPREWPQYEKMWDELFPTLEVVVEVESKIERTGMLRNPEPGNG